MVGIIESFESGSGIFGANSCIADSAVLIVDAPIRIVACDFSCDVKAS